MDTAPPDPEVNSSQEEKPVERRRHDGPKTLEGIKGAWVNEQKIVVENGKITEFRVNMKVTFILEG
jgi:flavin-binding protein dodecin